MWSLETSINPFNSSYSYNQCVCHRSDIFYFGVYVRW
ncbi:unnamed protein product [Ixodes pacificus]